MGLGWRKCFFLPNLASLPDAPCRPCPDATALCGPAGRLTYAALHDHIAAAAALLAAHGIGHGDRLGFLGHNHPSQLVLLFACARLGAVQVPLNWRLAAPELALILEDSEARRWSSPRANCGRRRSAPRRRAASLLDAEAAWPGLVSSRLAPPAAADLPDAVEPEDPVLLVYTSGTTGRAEGRRARPAGAAVQRAEQPAHAFALTAADRVLTVLPLFHVGGLNIQTTPALLAGAEVVAAAALRSRRPPSPPAPSAGRR